PLSFFCASVTSVLVLHSQPLEERPRGRVWRPIDQYSVTRITVWRGRLGHSKWHARQGLVPPPPESLRGNVRGRDRGDRARAQDGPLRSSTLRALRQRGPGLSPEAGPCPPLHLTLEGQEVTTAVVSPGQLFGLGALLGVDGGATHAEAMEESYI